MLTLRQRYLTEWLKCYNTADTAVSGVVDQKVGGAESSISDRQLQISDRGHYGCSKFQFCP